MRPFSIAHRGSARSSHRSFPTSCRETLYSLPGISFSLVSRRSHRSVGDNEHGQLVDCKELWCCVTSVENFALQGVVPGSLPSVFQRISGHTTVFAVAKSRRSNSPRQTAVPTTRLVGPRNTSSSSTWKYALVTSAV